MDKGRALIGGFGGDDRGSGLLKIPPQLRPGNSDKPPMELISVVVPCFKVEQFLSQAIESVLSQTYSNWELVVVDDESPDRCLDIAEEYGRKDPRIRFVRRPNGGVSAARNTGFNAATVSSDFIVFLDPDDLLLPAALEEMSAYLRANPSVGAVVCEISDIDEYGRSLGDRRKNRWGKGVFLPRKIKPTEPVTPFLTFFCGTGQGPHTMHRRWAFEATGGWDEGFRRQQDTDLFCRLALIAPIHFLNRRLYLYRKWKGQAVGNGAEIGHFNTKFREKWDLVAGKTPQEERLLSQARSFYWHVFFPCHEIKVVVACLPGFLRRPNIGTAGWLWMLIRNALLAALFGSPNSRGSFRDFLAKPSSTPSSKPSPTV